jgi:hypothetical protein
MRFHNAFCYDGISVAGGRQTSGRQHRFVLLLAFHSEFSGAKRHFFRGCFLPTCELYFWRYPVLWD